MRITRNTACYFVVLWITLCFFIFSSYSPLGWLQIREDTQENVRIYFNSTHENDFATNTKTKLQSTNIPENNNNSINDATYNLSKFQNRVENIYFIKVHKAGSTTVQNMLYRFGFNNDRLIALFDCPHGMPFPQVANSKYFVRDKYRKEFNIVCDHAMYDERTFR